MERRVPQGDGRLNPRVVGGGSLLCLEFIRGHHCEEARGGVVRELEVEMV